MRVKKIVKNAYSALTIIAILMAASTTVTFIELLPAILHLWFLYFVFVLGYNEVKKHNIYYDQEKKNKDYLFYWIERLLKHKLFILIICFLSSILITRFYTGQTPVLLLQGLINGIDFYAEYQANFNSNNLNILSINKIPFILMNFLMNGFTVLSYINQIVINEKADIKFLILLAIPYLAYGFARGTNFELFLLSFLTLFCLLFRANIKGKIGIIKGRHILLIALSAFIVYTIFSSVVSTRYKYFGISISREIKYDENELFARIFPNVSIAITKLGQYFGFGFFYVSTFINDVLFLNIKNLISYLLPFSSKVLGATTSQYVNELIDQSTNWVPDLLSWYSNLGLILIVNIVYQIGRMCAKCVREKDIVHISLLYFLVLQMFSLPIGNLVVVLSANRLILLTLISLLVLKRIKKRGKEF